MPTRLALAVLALVGCAGPDPAATSVALQRSPAPFLQLGLPDAPDAIVTGGPHFHAVSLRRGPLTISLHTTDLVHAEAGDEVEAPALQHVVRGRPASVTVNDGIRAVAWEEGGVFHALEVECYDPFGDPRCAEEAYVLRTAESLVVLSTEAGQ